MLNALAALLVVAQPGAAAPVATALMHGHYDHDFPRHPKTSSDFADFWPFLVFLAIFIILVVVENRRKRRWVRNLVVLADTSHTWTRCRWRTSAACSSLHRRTGSRTTRIPILLTTDTMNAITHIVTMTTRIMTTTRTMILDTHTTMIILPTLRRIPRTRTDG